MELDANALLSTARHGALGTLLDGNPYVSLVAVATSAGRPVFLLSHLAEHTKNLARDPRASLLIAEAGEGDPLARGRATFLGKCTPAPREEVGAAYLAVHPEAAAYLEMRDFGFFRLEVQAVRTIAGFGAMGWTPRRPA
jgi:heme iron utilization protein